MSRCGRRMVSSDQSKSIICDLPIDIQHRILELMPIKYAARTSILSKQWSQLWYTLPHLLFDHMFFQHVSNYAGGIIRKILMQHTGPILGFHLVSETRKLSQSYVDRCIVLVANHVIQKLTLDMANDELYTLPVSVFTCAALTHLKLSRCIVKFPDSNRFPKLVGLQLEEVEIDRPKQTTLILPMLETLELKYCDDVDYVRIVSLKLVNLSVLSTYAITFQCFNVNPIFRKIKHLCLDGSSLKVRISRSVLFSICFVLIFDIVINHLLLLQKLGSVCPSDRLDVSLNLQSLKICDLKISVKRIMCALCLLRNSPNLVELDIDEVVKVRRTSTTTSSILYIDSSGVLTLSVFSCATITLGNFSYIKYLYMYTLNLCATFV